ncbi:MAG TPA: peptidoglycan DD-metalloendopeptidase family protein [Actinomycetales bacterium]|nr:peptidoglycan DD-metalloendopeptidase family protein [Actinomycetales bacterium]
MRLPRMIRVPAVGVTAILATTLATPAPTAQAGPDQRKRQVDASIEDLRDDLEGTSADLSAAYLRLQGVQRRLPGARAALGHAESELADAAARDRQIGQQLTVARASEAKALDDLAQTARSTSDTTTVLGDIARQAYQTGGVGELAVALQAQDADDFATRLTLVGTAMRIQGDALADLDVAHAESSAKRARLTAVRQQIALLKAQAEANLERARQLRQQAAAAKAQVERLLSDQRREVATIESRKAAERRRLDRLQAESDALQRQLAEIARRQREAAAARARARAAAERAREVRARERAEDRAQQRARDGARSARRAQSSRRSSAARSSGGGLSALSVPSSGGYLSAPVSGGYISSEFGRRFHPILHYWRLHAGMDYGVGCGTPVHASADGQVISAGWGGGYGNRIVVNHGLVRGVSLSTTYNHLSRIVAHGGHVSRGELIGYSGTTGTSTGCHLHFETYEDGAPVNPRRWT